MSIEKCKAAIQSLKTILAQAREYSQDNPVFPVRLIFGGEKGIISQQLADLREKDPNYDGTDESELVEQFIDTLYKLHDKAGDGYASVRDMVQIVEQFCEMYPKFRPGDFYFVDVHDERFPIDIAAAGQQEIPIVTQPHQLTFPGSGVEPEAV